MSGVLVFDWSGAEVVDYRSGRRVAVILPLPLAPAHPNNGPPARTPGTCPAAGARPLPTPPRRVHRPGHGDPDRRASGCRHRRWAEWRRSLMHHQYSLHCDKLIRIAEG
ncbi:hypothetical protein GCM10010430_25320 [Kitasatospora cystarginea]|uniref:Uncharacterized protein n=1 Tax=Kitasatospora cystarginea TaxID=58350 RepID=A0ABP5QV04_9ACTN